MIYQDVYGVLRRLLSRALAAAIRSAATALLTPLHYSYQSGHFRSSIVGRAVDKVGAPLPWLTYPAIHLLRAKRFETRDVLEFGGGQSTLWWSERARIVCTLEDDVAWVDRLRSRVPANVDLHLVSRSLGGCAEILGDRRFNVIVIDGLDRVAAARMALSLVKSDGCVVLDNSEGRWAPGDSHPIIDFFRGHGFQRVDLYGHCPAVILPHCTSVFFETRCFLFEGSETPSMPCE